VIAVVDPTLPNSLEVDVHYQVVGGEYTDYQQLILEMLKTQTIDERGVAWGDIKGKPSLFKPTPHDHDVGGSVRVGVRRQPADSIFFKRVHYSYLFRR